MDVSLTDGLRTLLGEVSGSPISEVEVRRFTGGASREVYAVSAGEELRAVLRRDPPGHGDAARMRAEAACLRAARDAGVPVPAVLAAGDSAPGIDAPYLLMEMVDGESIPRKLQRNPEFAALRERIAGELGYVLGLIHRTPLDTLGELDRHDPLDTLERIYRDLDDPRPVVEMGLRRLRDNPPRQRPEALVHGDFRLGNFLIAPGGVRAVLDWELAHIGNPIEDLGWLCVRAWRFGAPQPVGGLGTREDLLDGYQRATGLRPSEAELHWWEVFGTLKWLVFSRFQAERHFSGAERSVELAAIGRRVCESEYDLLSVLGLLDTAALISAATTTAAADCTAPPTAPVDVGSNPTKTGSPVPPSAPTVHDRPDVLEILDLVAETLLGDIGSTLTPDQQRAHYLLRVCATLLGTVGRELRSGTQAGDEVSRLLEPLGCATEADLAAALRAGSIDYAEPTVRQVVSLAVVSRLRVANPRHLG